MEPKAEQNCWQIAEGQCGDCYAFFSLLNWNLIATCLKWSLETNANNVSLSLVEPISAAQPLAELKLNLI